MDALVRWLLPALIEAVKVWASTPEGRAKLAELRPVLVKAFLSGESTLDQNDESKG